MASPTPQSQASMLATITTDLDKIAPRFEVQPDQITIIQTPAEFYETLKVGRSHSLYDSSITNCQAFAYMN
jgi:CDP-diacylglycerol--glycerol-3-phosphate 3-phosphatidyltransferase